MTARMRASLGRVTLSVLLMLITASLILVATVHRSAQAGEPPVPGAFHLPPSFDIDGDGTTDLIQTRPSYHPESPGLGAVDVYSLSTLQRIAAFGNSGDLDIYGIAAGAAGDIDGDGSDDIVVGASHAKPHGDYSGRIYVYSGATHALLRTIDGPHEHALMGRAVAGAGDVNGDGVPDLAASGFIPDDGRNPIGQVYCIFRERWRAFANLHR